MPRKTKKTIAKKALPAPAKKAAGKPINKGNPAKKKGTQARGVKWL